LLATYEGKENFIADLNDGNMLLEVMKWEPQNVEAALSHAIKLEAYEQSLSCQGNSVDRDDSHAKHQLWTVCRVAEPLYALYKHWLNRREG